MATLEPTVQNDWKSTAFGLMVLHFGVFPITPSDSVALQYIARRITCTGNGNVNVMWWDGSTSIEAVTTTAPLKGVFRQVLATSTTATGLVGYR